MSCYAYEQLDSCFIDDRSFDMLGYYIDEHWEELEHPHKEYVDRERVAHTSSLTVPYHELPLIVLWATHHKLETEFRASRIYKKAMLETYMRELI